MTEFDPGAASQPTVQLAAVSNSEYQGLGLLLKRGAAGLAAVLAVGGAATFESAAQSGTAAAAEIPITFTPPNPIPRECGTQVLTLNSKVSGQGLAQGVEIRIRTLNPSGTEAWQPQTIFTNSDNASYEILIAPTDANYPKGPDKVDLHIDQLDSADLTTWHEDVVPPIPDVVESCTTDTPIPPTHVPKPTETAKPKPSVAPTHPAKPPLPTSVPSVRPSTSQSVIIRPVTPTSSVEAVAPPVIVASSPDVPVSSEPASPEAVIVSSPVDSQPASSNNAPNSQSAPPSVVARGNSSGNGSGTTGGNTLPGFVWAILGVGGAGAAGLWGIRRFLHKPNSDRPPRPRPLKPRTH